MNSRLSVAIQLNNSSRRFDDRCRHFELFLGIKNNDLKFVVRVLNCRVELWVVNNPHTEKMKCHEKGNRYVMWLTLCTNSMDFQQLSLEFQWIFNFLFSASSSIQMMAKFTHNGSTRFAKKLIFCSLLPSFLKCFRNFCCCSSFQGNTLISSSRVLSSKHHLKEEIHSLSAQPSHSRGWQKIRVSLSLCCGWKTLIQNENLIILKAISALHKTIRTHKCEPAGLNKPGERSREK